MTRVENLHRVARQMDDRELHGEIIGKKLLWSACRRYTTAITARRVCCASVLVYVQMLVYE